MLGPTGPIDALAVILLPILFGTRHAPPSARRGPCWRLKRPDPHTCRQIGSFARAQELLSQGHTNLDKNGDGVACESLR